jgi:predicted GNAT family acetyltransferase
MEAFQRVGLATTARYGQKIAWIGNVVVKKQYRRRHVGQRLVEHAIGYLSKKHVKHIALYSFEENIPFYMRLGFVQGPRFARLRRELQSSRGMIPQISPSNPLPLPRLLAIDQKAFGADRRRLLRLLLNTDYAWCLSYMVGASSSFILVKKYKDMYEFGPWASFGLDRTQLGSLLQMALNKADDKPVEVSCPLTNRKAIEIMKSRNFQVINDGRLMFYRRMAKFGQPEAVVAFGFLDKG